MSKSHECVKSSSIQAIIAIILLATFSCTVGAQQYPSRLVRIVTAEAGGGNDVVSRLIGQGLTANLHQQVIVDNRGSFAIEAVIKAPADGYTLLLYGPTVWLLPFLRENVTFDSQRDLAPITLAVSSPILVVVHPSLPVKTIRGLIALAKSRPGALNYAAGTIGSTPHLAAELFRSMASIDIVRVPYRGTGPGLAATIAGQVQLMFPSVNSASPHIASGRLRAIAVATAKPTILAPNLPLVSADLPGYEAVSVFGVFAPAGTPLSTINFLSAEIARVLSSRDLKDRLLSNGLDVVGSSPEEFSQKIKAEIARMGQLIKDSGIRG
jgi:tripartite-type tricarboxylate transporter receptor subunit TctC